MREQRRRISIELLRRKFACLRGNTTDKNLLAEAAIACALAETVRA
jgi:hypothetical protein